jgi:hypothetical protein
MSREPPYQVVWARTARENLQTLSNNTTPENRKKLVRVVRELDERLRQDPLVVGEVYRVRGEIEEHMAVHEFLAIDFAVDKNRKFVLVRDCRALSGFGR